LLEGIFALYQSQFSWECVPAAGPEIQNAHSTNFVRVRSLRKVQLSEERKLGQHCTLLTISKNKLFTPTVYNYQSINDHL